MTSDQLAAELAGHHKFGNEKVLFSPEDVYIAAHFAQTEILTLLKCLERTSRLKLISGQELYTFPESTVTGCTTASPAVLTIADHPYNTGDEVVVASVGGMTGVNGYRTVTKVDDDHISLDDTTGTGTYTSGGTVNHAINSAHSIKLDGIRRISNEAGGLYGTLTKKYKTEIEKIREDFTESVDEAQPINFWEENTDPITIGVQGTPASDTLVEVSYYRKPLASERISGTVNPILPLQYDYLLMLGALYYMYNNPRMFEDFMEGRRKRALDEYTAKLGLTGNVNGKARRVASGDVSRGVKI